MPIDIDVVARDMLAAVLDAVGASRADVRPCARRIIDEERGSFLALAQARLGGELDDDAFAARLLDEADTLASLLRVCQRLDADSARRAGSAALGALQQAVVAAVAPHAAAVAAAAKAAGKGGPATVRRRLNARPDTVDFRDRMYVPTLVEVGTQRSVKDYLRLEVPVLDQGEEGACTGFGLATVVHYLLRQRAVTPDNTQVSARMLYAMARRYDEWPGEAYEGSSCRGAMKGWHKHGVCAGRLWKHDPAKTDNTLSSARAADALARPLGAYFRVNHKDLVAMHTAIAETGILYASGRVHEGWQRVEADGVIKFSAKDKILGGHAFALVAYDADGFWLQNSWGPNWGRKGLAHIAYSDWLQHGSDVWVARLGVPVRGLGAGDATTNSFTSSSLARAVAYDEIRPHVVSIGNNGRLRNTGNLATGPDQVRHIFRNDFPRITQGWKKRRIVLYAHGGLVSEESALQRVTEYRQAMLDAQCYPVAFVWRTDFWSTLKNMLEDAVGRRKQEGVLDSAKDFMLDRLDDALEPLARSLSGKASWDEMKENALAATQSADGGARLVLDEVAALLRADPGIELHLVAHSAGSIFHAPLLQRLTASAADGGLGLPVASCTLWAPACTMGLFEQTYAPALRSGALARAALYTLTDAAERDDHCARIYNKSLLYLVSHAFEARPRIPLMRPDGEPLLGMAKFVERSATVKALLKSGQMVWGQSPNALPATASCAAAARAHGDFDDDAATVQSSLAWIVGAAAGKAGAGAAIHFRSGSASLRNLRGDIDKLVR
jgi:Papain family cysteine protease